ncbi:MAG: 3-deoxy-manno-octulosonate cytidylyltransferase [Desulfobacterota bacterium]|nr:3-deoxy-manno-octulosonate cytidylyltransferase [Thermodesulfobacteriota bacterium]
MHILAVIPARYGSTRFEGKPLAEILGKPMIQWVYEGVAQSRLVEKILVATDDRRIAQAVEGFGGEAILTSPDHPTGTDRVAEVARRTKATLIVNVQGDEPLIRGAIIDKAIRPLLRDESLPMSSLMTEIRDLRDWVNPNQGKVVVDGNGFALYFSRSPIPYPRDFTLEQILTDPDLKKDLLSRKLYKTIGLYVYRRDFLLKLSRIKPTPLEALEKLEQLRVLEKGYRIKMVSVDYEPIGVDTPEDLQKVRAVLSQTIGDNNP